MGSLGNIFAAPIKNQANTNQSDSGLGDIFSTPNPSTAKRSVPQAYQPSEFDNPPKQPTLLQKVGSTASNLFSKGVAGLESLFKPLAAPVVAQVPQKYQSAPNVQKAQKDALPALQASTSADVSRFPTLPNVKPLGNQPTQKPFVYQPPPQLKQAADRLNEVTSGIKLAQPGSQLDKVVNSGQAASKQITQATKKSTGPVADFVTNFAQGQANSVKDLFSIPTDRKANAGDVANMLPSALLKFGGLQTLANAYEAFSGTPLANKVLPTGAPKNISTTIPLFNNTHIVVQGYKEGYKQRTDAGQTPKQAFWGTLLQATGDFIATAAIGMGIGKSVIGKFSPEAFLKTTEFDTATLREHLATGESSLPADLQEVYKTLPDEQKAQLAKGVITQIKTPTPSLLGKIFGISPEEAQSIYDRVTATPPAATTTQPGQLPTGPLPPPVQAGDFSIQAAKPTEIKLGETSPTIPESAPGSTTAPQNAPAVTTQAPQTINLVSETAPAQSIQQPVKSTQPALQRTQTPVEPAEVATKKPVVSETTPTDSKVERQLQKKLDPDNVFRNQVFDELLASRPGERVVTATGENIGSKSTFPKWVPEELRSTELFDRAIDVVAGSNVATPGTKVGQLVDVINKQISNRLEISPEMIKQEATTTKPTKTSGVAKSIETKAIQAKLTKGFGDLAGFDSSSIEKQAKLSSEVIASGHDALVKTIRGELALPEGLKGGPFIVAVEEYLKKNPSSELAYELANSPLTSGVSEAASELGLMQNREPDSAVAKIREIKKAREAKAGIRNAAKQKTKVLNDLKAETKKINLPKEELQWDKFLTEIGC